MRPAARRKDRRGLEAPSAQPLATAKRNRTVALPSVQRRGFAGGREDDTRKQAFTLDADEPRLVAGADSAPNSMEYVLHALVSCMTGTMVYHAAVRGIEIAAVNSRIEGDMDVRGLLGMSEAARKFVANCVAADAESEQDKDNSVAA